MALNNAGVEHQEVNHADSAVRHVAVSMHATKGGADAIGVNAWMVHGGYDGDVANRDAYRAYNRWAWKRARAAAVEQDPAWAPSSLRTDQQRAIFDARDGSTFKAFKGLVASLDNMEHSL